jgi:hypothetical protein
MSINRAAHSRAFVLHAKRIVALGVVRKCNARQLAKFRDTKFCFKGR